MYKKLGLLSILFIIVDQLIKIVISNTITYNTEVKVIPGFFYLANVHNEGAAFSLFNGNQIFLILMTLIAVVVIYYVFIKDKKLNKLEIVLTSMLMGGIVGNFIDRIIHGYVIDYLGFIFGSYYYPIFNFADICIVVSIFVLLFLSFKEDVWKSLKSKKKSEE
jgi:signal peptidase II